MMLVYNKCKGIMFRTKNKTKKTDNQQVTINQIWYVTIFIKRKEGLPEWNFVFDSLYFKKLLFRQVGQNAYWCNKNDKKSNLTN